MINLERIMDRLFKNSSNITISNSPVVSTDTTGDVWARNDPVSSNIELLAMQKWINPLESPRNKIAF